jgi:hypothetical protein
VGYVGRNSSGGCRDFYFYIATAEGWQSKADRVLAEFKSTSTSWIRAKMRNGRLT